MPDLDLLLKFKNNIAAVTDDGKYIRYGDICDFARLIYSKINHRCLVFCLCKNQIDSLCGYVSFVSNRIVPLLLDSSLDKGLLNELILTYKPEFLWLPNSEASDFFNGEVIFNTIDYTLIRLKFDSYYELNHDLALLLTTSGSTGSPKLVRMSYDNIDSNAKSIVEYLSITENERPITTLPMSYTYGLSIINSHMLVGSTLLLTSKTLMEKMFWEFFREQNASSFGGVPYTYEILKKLRFFRMDLPSLKTMTQAGGKLTPELTKEFAEFAESKNMQFIVMYGQTEATARMSYLPSEYSVSKAGSMGIAIPGGEFSLIDEKGMVILEPDITGELVYKGPNVTLGYAECGEDLIKGDERGGVLITGDMAKRDKDGFYYITGRKKRFIKLYGNRVNLDEAERLIKTIIPDCACAGQDDKMVIYITDPLKETEVRDFISKKTGINLQAFSVKHIDKIPKNESGKTIYLNLDLS